MAFAATKPLTGARETPRRSATNTADDRALVVESVEKHYGTVSALQGVDLEIASGEIVALLGPNGAGKTTLISIVSGLRRPDAGAVWVDGINVCTAPHRARERLGLAPQETGVYPTLSVYENLRFFGELSGLRRARLRLRIAEVAEGLELGALITRPVRTLSGGETRRVHTAMSLLGRPPVLVLDEPSTGMDTTTRARLLELIRELADRGTAICYSTHIFAEVEQLDSSVAILHHGRIVGRGTLAALIGRYGQASVKMRFDGPAPHLSGHPTALASDGSLRVVTHRPLPIEAAALLADIGDAAQRLRGVELIRPSLESVYTAITSQPDDGAGWAQGAAL
jgi:ABC-2 type transport system ATP-binding protein